MLIRITFFSIGLCLLFVFSGCEESIVIDYSGPISDWPSYGATAFGERYSPLTQITPENVKKLKVAWEYHTGDYSAGSKEIPTQSAFEVTPILVDTTMYISTPFNRIIALHPETGEEIWTYDPEIDLSGFYANQLISRGVSFWRDTCANGPCPGRIFSGTNDGRLIALDAATGKKSTDFGINGMIDLKSDVGKERWLGEYQVTSPPAIAGDLVIVGSAVCDNVRLDAPSGVVKAFHARTGELVWSWDLTPPGDSVNYAISEGGYTLGTPNVWAPMSVPNWEDGFEDFLQSNGHAPFGRHRHLKELIVGATLHLDQVRHLGNLGDPPEALANTLPTGECAGHLCLSLHYEIAFGDGPQAPPGRNPAMVRLDRRGDRRAKRRQGLVPARKLVAGR